MKKIADHKEALRPSDHKKIGQEQDLFLISQEVGSGFPLFAPKGFILRREVENYIISEKEKRGYQFVWTPHLAKSSIYKKSGHWQKFDAMFPPIELDKESYVLKPMNCPHHFEIYLSRPRSYRELPLRLAEQGTVYRYEKSGEVNGLLRTRSITIDDTHTFVRHEQIEEELVNILGLIESVLATFGFKDYRAQISLRDPKEKGKYLGDEKSWERAEKALVDASKKKGINYKVEEGEAAFYGPKIDVMVKDALGREWQLATAQLDFNQPENFKMDFVNEKGEKERPAVLHIAVLGSVERFLAVLIEHFEGAFPVWFSPVQVKILPVSEKSFGYAAQVSAKLRDLGLRTEVNERDETLPNKVRAAQLERVPYMFILGEKEEKEKKISLRTRDGQERSGLDLKEVVEVILAKVKSKSLAL